MLAASRGSGGVSQRVSDFARRRVSASRAAGVELHRRPSRRSRPRRMVLADQRRRQTRPDTAESELMEGALPWHADVPRDGETVGGTVRMISENGWCLRRTRYDRDLTSQLLAGALLCDDPLNHES